MRIDLRQVARRAGKTKSITLPALTPPKGREDDLARLTVAVVRAWQVQIKERVLPAYERDLGSMRATKDAEPETARSISASEAAISQLVVELGPDVQAWAIELDQWHRRRTVEEMWRALGVDLNNLLLPEGEVLEVWFQRMMGLVRNIDDTIRAKMSDSIWRGFQQLTPRRQIAKEINEVLQGQRARALRIATDMTTKLSARLDQARQEDLGFEEYEWLHSRKLHPRQFHVERNGNLFRWDKPPADGPPGTLPFCGCKAKAHLNLDDDE